MLTRIAPTPSGYLHLGNAVNFVLTWLAARQRNGRVWLRIDDLDAARKRPEYVADVFETLDWLGLDYDFGPTGPDDFETNWSQRHRLARYEATLGTLVDRGAVYASSLSRKQVAADKPSPERTQQLPLDAPDVVWRFRAEEPSPDFVVRRRDGLPAYQVASLTDDTDFGVTHLIRGQDLYASTAMQRQLAERLSLGASTAGTFLQAQVWHHPLLVDASGHKLAKSAGSGGAGPSSIRAMRAAGTGPERVFEIVGTLLRDARSRPLEATHSMAELLAQSLIPDDLFVSVKTIETS